MEKSNYEKILNEVSNFQIKEMVKKEFKKYGTVETFLEVLLTNVFLSCFWDEVEHILSRDGKINERHLQRIFSFQMKRIYPFYFTKMVSDIPTAAASLGYDIVIITPAKTIFIEMKVLKNAKVQESQVSFRTETKGFDFIEYHFLVWDIENKIYYLR